MGRPQLTAVVAAAAFGLTTAIVAAQGPQGRGDGPPPVPADPSPPQGPGRAGSPMQPRTQPSRARTA